MSRLHLVLAVFAASISILFYFTDITTFLQSKETRVASPTPPLPPTITTTADTRSSDQPMLKATSSMAKSVLREAKITPHRSDVRGHGDHGWLNTYHSFNFADWYDPRFDKYGAIRVLNEDRVKGNSGFPTHPHRDFEIFSYILSGELTHRDSMLSKGAEGGQSDKFYRMHRGDVQFTTGGTGIAHSEFNEHKDPVHFLQIWAIPWKRGLAPRYHTRNFEEAEKKNGFVKILSPLKAGEDATAQEEKDAEPTIPSTIPIHADLVMGAGLIAPESSFEWTVGDAGNKTKRKVFVHLPMTKNGKAKIRLDGREDAELGEGDGAFIEGVNKGDKLHVESIGEAEAEVIILDTA